MESFLSRYRNLSVLLLLIVAQLLLLAYQVKAGEDVRLIRVWAVTAVTPLARGIEWIRGGTGGFFSGYVFLRDVQVENQRLRQEVGQLRLRTQFLSAELATADRAKALLAFRSSLPSKTLPARVIGTGTGANARVVYVDRGSTDGVMKGMAAITPEGIVGKVVAAYPTASLVQLITEQGSVAGVISQKNRVRGILKGQGSANCAVEYIQNEDKLEAGEWFFTSGADRIFPRGLPVGRVKMVGEGRGGKEVIVAPSALQAGLEEMLIVLDGVHGLIPDPQTPASSDVSILAPPPDGASTQPASSAAEPSGAGLTDADRLREKYKRIGESQGIEFGASPGRVADFNRTPTPEAPAAKPEAAKPEVAKPNAPKPVPPVKQ
ncbi:MAG: rod shape-determining protein MreC [Acidobacteria bacterium]|nr:rod shape-determining protein MreC [Acidobacteriota bacterium]